MGIGLQLKDEIKWCIKENNHNLSMEALEACLNCIEKLEQSQQRVKELESALDIAENLLDDGVYQFYLESIKPLTTNKDSK